MFHLNHNKKADNSARTSFIGQCYGLRQPIGTINTPSFRL